MHVRTMGGTSIQAGSRAFIQDDTPREVARWRSALKELQVQELIEDVGYNGEVFEVTHRGHGVAEELQSLEKADPAGA